LISDKNYDFYVKL